LYSSVPKTVKEPYINWVTQPKDEVLQDGTVSALSIFYSETHQFESGDKISITASIDEGTLSVDIYDMWAFKEIAAQENVQSVDLDVTIPSNSFYEITVKRYKSSVFVIYTEKTNANVKITTRTTEQALVQAYRDVTTYPYKNLETCGIAVMVAGIGVGVLSIAQIQREESN
jgi:hypothetical protein